MGARGVVPGPEADLSRPRSRKGSDQQPVTIGTRKPVEIPEPDPTWHPIATRLYDSARDSGQSDFYQATDWAILWSLCEDLSMYKKPLVNRDGEEYVKRSGQMLQTIMSSLTSLLLTEGDRRRVRLELQEPAPDTGDATVTQLNLLRGMAEDE